MSRQDTENQSRLYSPKPRFPVNLLEDGDHLFLGDVELRAIHTPRLRRGIWCCISQNSRCSSRAIIFSSTLRPISACGLRSQTPLSDYIASLQKIRALPVHATFPAHRTAGIEIDRRIDQIIDHHGQRLDEIYLAAADKPGCTAYDIAGRIRWSARGMAWEQFPPHQKWFAMAETLARPSYLSDKRTASPVMKGETARYYLTSSSPEQHTSFRTEKCQS